MTIFCYFCNENFGKISDKPEHPLLYRIARNDLKSSRLSNTNSMYRAELSSTLSCNFIILRTCIKAESYALNFVDDYLWDEP